MTPLGYAARNSWRVNEVHADLMRDAGQPTPLSFPAEPQALTIDLARSAIVVIDMQNDFCHADGWLASIGVDVAAARTPIGPLTTLLPTLRDAGVPVIWLNWGNRPDRANLSPGVLHVYKPTGEGCGLGDPLPGHGARVLEKDSWAAATIDELAVGPQDILVDKFRMSGFWDTPLDSILRNLDTRTILFAGVNVDQCVLATLQDAACLGYDCVLLADCSATTSPEFCTQATLYNVKQCFGFVAHGADIVAALEPEASGR